jgi:glycine/D-amino acid oxidase-like deaminating enzyme
MHARPPSNLDVVPRPAASIAWWQQCWPSPGYAPLDRDARVDVVVVGGGVTGCSAALELARSGARVRLLEARDIAAGASGRNGGFLLAGMAYRIEALARLVGIDRAGELYHSTCEGRERLLETAHAIGADHLVTRTGSLRLAIDADELDELHREATLLDTIGDVRVRRLDAHELPPALVGHFLGGLHFPDDARSVPAGWVRALAAAAAEAGARLHEHSPVVALDADSDAVVARTADGFEIVADHAIVATEAWLPSLVPELSGIVLPYRSQVLAARGPVDANGDSVQVLPHVTWSRRGWDYAQQAADGTLVVGGEQLEDVSRLRHLDEQVEATDQAGLEQWIRRVIGVEPDVVARWAGVLSQTVDGFPMLGPVPDRPRVLTCGGWGGAGNVLGFVGGAMVARIALDGEDRIPSELRVDRIASAPTVQRT